MFNVPRTYWQLIGCLLSYCLAACPPTQGQLTTSKAEIGAGGLELVSLSKDPCSRVEKGGGFALRASVRNNGTDAAVGFLVCKITGQVGQEDCRQFELAAGEERIFEIPLRVSRNATGASVNTIVTLNAIENGREVMLQSDGEPVMKSLKIPFDPDSVSTAIELRQELPYGPEWRWPPKGTYASYELVVAARVDSGVSRRCINLENEPLPHNAIDWQGIDSLVIGSADSLQDAVAIVSIRNFLQRGGRVLLLLEDIDTALIRDLLSYGQQCETVDTVELNHFVFEVHSGVKFGLDSRTIDLDQPVRMKRVLQQGGRVTHSIDGWPATISMTIGDGELILSTVESITWLKPRQTRTEAMPHSDYSLPLWTANLTNVLISTLRPEPLEAIEATYPIELIGTPVLSRGWVAAALIGFCVLLVVFAGWNAMAGEMSKVGVIAPVLAIAASVPLFLASLWTRNDIPSMRSELQIVDFGPNGDGVLRSKSAVYLSSSRSMALVGNLDGYAVPSESIESGVRRLTTTDFQAWQLNNSDWPPGTWRYSTEVALPGESLIAPAKLTSKGLEITLPGNLPSKAEDVVVDFVRGSPTLGIWTEQDRRLMVDGELSTDGNRWTSDSIVSEEQGRRAKVYSDLFSPSDSRRGSPGRRLLFWTKPWPQSPKWSSDLASRGAALVSVPIQLETPQSGAEVLVPHSLIYIEPSNVELGISSAYNHRLKQWNSELAIDSDVDLSFVLPPEVVPFEATSIEIDWRIEAPKRTVKLIWGEQSSPIELVSLDGPTIPWRGTIVDPRVLKDFNGGRLDLRISVRKSGTSDDESLDNFVSWRVKHLRINVLGKTQPRNNISVQPQK
jgi:hypothetical protein